MSRKQFKPKSFKSIRGLQDSALTAAIKYAESQIKEIEKRGTKNPTVRAAVEDVRAAVADWKAYLEQRPINF